MSATGKPRVPLQCLTWVDSCNKAPTDDPLPLNGIKRLCPSTPERRAESQLLPKPSIRTELACERA
jgi:hypothetical protein